MTIADILQAAQQHEHAMLQASRVQLAAWGQEAEQYMQAIAPPPDDPRESVTDFNVVDASPQALEDGGAVLLRYVDPLGVLSARDLPPVGEDSRIVTDAMATKGPELTQKLKEVWQ